MSDLSWVSEIETENHLGDVAARDIQKLCDEVRRLTAALTEEGRMHVENLCGLDERATAAEADRDVWRERAEKAEKRLEDAEHFLVGAYRKADAPMRAWIAVLCDCCLDTSGALLVRIHARAALRDTGEPDEGGEA